jgi:hypothetical protein
MAAPQVFKVLTEFRFEVGSAVAKSEQLAGAVDKVSNAADQALISFQRMSIGMVAGYLSGPGGGVLGILGTAIKSSEQFLKAQVALANIMGRSAGSFAARMQFAKNEMMEIKRLSSEFGLPAEQLVNVTKFTAPALKGTFGAQGAIREGANLGRNFLKAAPSLGIDSAEALDNVQRALLGTMHAGDSLFQTLVADTKTFAQFNGQFKQFKAKSTAEKVKLLNEAFEEYSKDLDSVKRLQQSVNGQMQMFRENLVGMYSILRPLGDTINSVVVEALQRMNNYIDGTLRRTIENVSFAIEPFVKDMDTLLATFMQFRELKSDLQQAGTWLFRIGAMIGLQEALNFLGIKVPIVSTALGKLKDAIDLLNGSALAGLRTIMEGILPAAKGIGTGIIASFIPFLKSAFSGIKSFFKMMPTVFKYLNTFTKLMSTFLIPIIALVTVFQLLSRAVAIFKIEKAKMISASLERLSEVGALISRFLAVFLEGFDNLARGLAVSPVFDILFKIVNTFVDVVETVVKGLVLAAGTFQGLVFVVMEMANNVTTMFKLMARDILMVLSGLPGLGDLKPKGPAPKFKGAFGGEIFKAFDTGVENMLEKVFGKPEEDLPLSGMQQTNNITNNFDIKEKIEPDRIAFTLTDQLQKLAQNPRGAQDKPLGTVTVGG